ncbi:response regulator [Hoeflea prorocentri]|uniref:Sensory/regulatory protein RpfC n=1 Tax=Hoeflea prorocentri TaxID=1922333 RepID=A0A9X3UJ70_9HYPH|nr:response regulator [Hoeflea prorocentri]MCY6381607.1 response regulator [Hoeflea prorocentri]MDA5399407.1 response regulator [Hoeflea prorocentri]
MSEAETAEIKGDEIQLIFDAMNAMAQGVLVHTHEEILYSNPQLADILEIPPELVRKGASFEKFIQFGIDRGDERKAPQSEIFDQATTEQVPDEGELLERSTPGGKIIQISVKPGRGGKRVTTYSDVTQDRARERDLAEARSDALKAEQAKSEFLANMSHEIRTPMNGVMGMAELLAKTDLDAKQAMFTDVIIKSGASLLTIINDILDFSKIDAGRMELDPAPFNLAEAIEDVATLVSSRVAEKDLELIVRVDPELPQMLVGDVGRIRQIITNLVGNAVKFTDEGHVYVNATALKPAERSTHMQGLRIAVLDTGIGLPKEDLDRIFDKFSQVDASATRKHEGTGLGLSIASSLVRLLGGTLNVESVVGEGSTFWFEIDLPVHREEKATRVPVDVTGSRVLIIDDNPVNRSILTEQIGSWKFDCAAASGGQKGIALMHAAIHRGLSIDCVVLDYQMPDMCGSDVVHAMRTDPDLSDIPIIMLTSVDETKEGRSFSSLDIQAHLTKPARSSLLLETIVQVLQDNQSGDCRSLQSPIDPTAEMAAAEIEVQRPVPQQNPVTLISDGNLDVLVCEDNDVNQMVFTQILNGMDYSFKIAGNGKEGLSLYKNLSPALILMDVSMPVMNGHEATRAIRQIEAETGGHTPIIGVTAHAIKGDMEQCIEAGMDDYLSKPISPDALAEKIEHWMIERENRRQA